MIVCLRVFKALSIGALVVCMMLIESITEDRFENALNAGLYKNMLDDQFYLSDQVKELANELSILALFKSVEISTKRAIQVHLPSISERDISKIDRLKAAHPFDVENVTEFDAFNELRLINNCIKRSGTVSNELGTEYSHWAKRDKLDKLDKGYEELKPRVKLYVSSLISEIVKHSVR